MCPTARDFFDGQAIFPQEYWLYFKEKWSGTAEKEPLFGRVDSFQIGPRRIVANFRPFVKKKFRCNFVTHISQIVHFRRRVYGII